MKWGSALALGLLTIFFVTDIGYAGYVQGYSRKDGTYVQGHYRSNPNSTVTDNYSFKGNVNPYTAKVGTNYYRNSPSSPYYGTSPSPRNRFVASSPTYSTSPSPNRIASSSQYSNTGPQLYSRDGKYLGNVNNNRYDPNSVSNPYGRYGSKYSADSINNPYGQYGSRYSNQSVNNPYATKPPVLVDRR